MSFSICIPNYNYEQYLGITLDSILSQTYSDLEIVIADNKSTDSSIQIIQEYRKKNPQIRYKVNPVNLGFAGNLDAVASMANKQYMIMLSSDDVMKANALSTYKKLLELLPTEESHIITSAIDTINSEGEWLSTSYAKDAYRTVWKQTDIDQALSATLGMAIYKVPAEELLNRVISTSSNPLNFLATCYRRKDYELVGGYGSSRMINPDKWFHWRLLGQVKQVYFIDEPLFQYRWHERNQTAQQKNSGHLKFLTDEYKTTVELSNEILKKVELKREDLQHFFIKNIILRHGLGELGKGLWVKAYRINRFGWATYPKIMLKFWPKSLVFFLLLLGGPLGKVIVQFGKNFLK